ncbi:MAG: SAM-dependent chlorinase/fluorinase [Gemmatimonadetes bacterium]|nr:SAM-dependent chlorinase/fluorinase [Gemmatimonadota bacterium]
MQPVITLLTDFGQSDGYVAEVKAVLVTALPAVRLIDISHDVPPGNILAAQYLLGRCWPRFPSGTVHLVVVDPGVGTDRRPIAVENNGHRFVGPDSGVLTPVLEGATVVELAVPPDASPTFHGRDVFAPAAAKLAGGADLPQLGVGVVDPVRVPFPAPRKEQRGVVGTVVYVDRFGTLISNIPGGWASGAAVVRVRERTVGPLKRTFGDVDPVQLIAFVGSGGTIEIAVRDASAAERLGAGVGTEVRVD